MCTSKHISPLLFVSTISKTQGGKLLHQQSPPFWTIVDKTDNHRSEDRYVEINLNKSEQVLLCLMMKWTPLKCMQGKGYEINSPASIEVYRGNFNHSRQ